MEPSVGWGNEDNKKYYEAELQRKIIYVPNLSFFLNNLHLQILKLPHQMQETGRNDITGTTYDDIVKSFCNGVEVVFAILAPVRKQLETEMADREDGEPWKDCEIEVVDFKTACQKLAWIYQLLDDIDMLNSRVITMDLPDIENNYDRDLEVEDAKIAVGIVPPPVPIADDEAVGEVDRKDKRPVA